MQHQTKTSCLGSDKASIRTAAELVRAGALVAFPTETVYGLGADARNGTAVAGIFEAKGRPSFNPLIVHVSRFEDALEIAKIDGPLATIANAFWPGPLSIVAPLREASGISELVTAGLDTVALRVPGHPVAQKLLGAFGGPIAAPSANRSGQISPTTAEHVMAELSGRIAAVIDDGPCSVGLESTIVGLSGNQLELLRPGGTTRDAIETTTGLRLHNKNPSAALNAPGQLGSHYAPQARIRLDAAHPGPNEAYLAFGQAPILPNTLNLSDQGDLREAAANLFAHLRVLDQAVRIGNLDGIAVAPVPTQGLGQAINDRLQRAAAPRPERQRTQR